MEENVEDLEPEADVLPLGLDDDQGLSLHPRQEVVVVAVEHGVGRLRGRWLRSHALIKLVPEVPDAHLV